MALALTAIIALTPSAFAQTTGSATLRGVVRDQSGDVVSGATVTLTSVTKETSRTVETTSEGVYVFAQIDPDTYTLKVEAPNFKTHVQSDLTISPSDTRGQDIALEVGGTTEVVNVTTQEEIQTETGEKASTITQEQIQNLSLIGRSSLELLRILPGVVTPESNQLETIGFNAGGNANANYSVNGLRGVNNNVSIDGSRVVDIGSNNGSIITANNDMVQEVKVQVSNYAAEYGSSAVQISAVTKGGGKDFHGSLYYYTRPWWAAANDRSRNNAGGDLLERPRNKFNYPGGNISGPVIFPGLDFNKNRDKMFFFFGLEIQRQSVAADTRYAVVPTLAQRMGDFSEFLNNPGLFNQPQFVNIPGGNPDAGMQAPGGNLAPYIDPIGQALLNLYPLPTGNYVNGRYNYATAANSDINRKDMKLRVDYKISEATNLYVRWARESESIDYPYGIWWAASNYELPTPVVGTNLGRSVAVSVTTVINPTMVNEFVFSASKLKLDNDNEDPAKVSRSALGLDAFRSPFGTNSPNAPLYIASWANGGALWSPGPLPLFAYNDSYAITDNLSKVWGSHTMKFGGLIEQANKKQNFQNNADGQVELGTWIPGSTGSEFGDLLTGHPAVLYQDTVVPTGNFRLYNIEGYAQDSWKLRPNFTLELGARVSYFPNNYERKGLGAVFDPDSYIRGAGPFINGDPTMPNGILTAARGEIPKGINDNPPIKIAPRIGFAWDLFGTARTVLRGGAGVFYNRVQGNYQYDALRLPPNAYTTRADVNAVEGGLTFENFGDINPYTQGRNLPAGQNIDDNQIPRIVTTSLSIAQRLGFDTVLEASYVGTQARHLPQRQSYNAIAPGQIRGNFNGLNLDDPRVRYVLDDSITNQFRPFSDYNDVLLTQFSGTSSYHSLQTTVSRQQSERFQFFLAYTFSKALGTNAVNETGQNVDPVDTRGRSYGVLPFDRTHIFNVTYVLKLWDGARGSFDNWFTRGALNGWQVSGITNVQSGRPILLRPNIDGAIDTIGDYNSDQTRRAYFGTPSGLSGIGFLGDPRLEGNDLGERILDGNQIYIPSFGDVGTFQTPWYIRSPRRTNTDLTLFKFFNITERQNVEFRVGVFNIFNQAFPNPDIPGDIDLDLQTQCIGRMSGIPDGNGDPSGDVCDPTQGFRITNPDTFGRINNKHGRRVIEFALKYNF